MQTLFLILSVLIFTHAGDSEANSLKNIDNYLDAKAPNRYALLIGNIEYSERSALGGVSKDIELMDKKLTELGFHTDVKKNVTSMKELQTEVLANFRKKISKDDFVVIYLSGHGFSYGGLNYFALTDIPKLVPERKVIYHAFPVEGFGSFFSSEDPAAVLIIVDACRNIGNFIEDDDSTRLKGLRGSASGMWTRSDYMAAYATVNGGFAVTSDDNPSVYTRYLSNYIDKPGRFTEIHRDVRYDVMEEASELAPQIVDNSVTSIFFVIDEQLQSEYERMWRYVFDFQNEDAVSKFIERHSLNPYVVSARKWLKDYKNSNKLTSYTRYPPGYVSSAWGEGKRAGSSVRVMAMSNSSPLAFERLYAGDSSNLFEKPFSGNITGPEASLYSMSTFEGKLGMANTVKDLAKAKAIRGFDACRDIQCKNSELVRFNSNEKIAISGVQTDSERVLLELSANKSKKAYYEVDNSSFNIEYFGSAITEIDALPVASYHNTMVNEKDLVAKLNMIKNDYYITWVSIKNNHVEGDDTGIGVLEDRALHARYICIENGIDGKRITISTKSKTEGQSGTVLEIFGIDRDLMESRHE